MMASRTRRCTRPLPLWWSMLTAASATARSVRRGRCVPCSRSSCVTPMPCWWTARERRPNRSPRPRGRCCCRCSAAGCCPMRWCWRPSGAGRGVCRDGHPEEFFATLSEAGVEVRDRLAFPDHHRFRRGEALDLIARAERDGVVLVTTEKDFARLSGPTTSRRWRRRPGAAGQARRDRGGGVPRFRAGADAQPTSCDPDSSAAARRRARRRPPEVHAPVFQLFGSGSARR